MELFGIDATQSLFMLFALVLLVLPVPNIIATMYMVKIYRADDDRPRNGILSALLTNAVFTTIASVIIFALAVDFWIGLLFLGERLTIDFGGVMLAASLSTALAGPTMIALALRKINGRAEEINQIPEEGQVARNAAEDERFGRERRTLEREHVREQEELDSRRM